MPQKTKLALELEILEVKVILQATQIPPPYIQSKELGPREDVFRAAERQEPRAAYLELNLSFRSHYSTLHHPLSLSHYYSPGAPGNKQFWELYPRNKVRQTNAIWVLRNLSICRLLSF